MLRPRSASSGPPAAAGASAASAGVPATARRPLRPAVAASTNTGRGTTGIPSSSMKPPAGAVSTKPSGLATPSRVGAGGAGFASAKKADSAASGAGPAGLRSAVKAADALAALGLPSFATEVRSALSSGLAESAFGADYGLIVNKAAPKKTITMDFKVGKEAIREST